MNQEAIFNLDTSSDPAPKKPAGRRCNNSWLSFQGPQGQRHKFQPPKSSDTNVIQGQAMRLSIVYMALLAVVGCAKSSDSSGPGDTPTKVGAKEHAQQVVKSSDSAKPANHTPTKASTTKPVQAQGTAKGTPGKPRLVEQVLKNAGGFWGASSTRFQQVKALRQGTGPEPKPGVAQFYVYDTVADDGTAKTINHGKFTAKLENGQTYEEGEYEHNKQTGLWTEYQRATERQGKRIVAVDRYIVWRTTTYKAGVKDGPYIRFDSFGQKEEEGQYTASKKSGLWKHYKDGIISEEAEYQNDLQHGSAVIYATSLLKGQVKHFKKEEGQYARGNRTGTWTSYDASGRSRTHHYK